MTKKRIVIDTTVLISAALWPEGTPRAAVFAALEQHTVLISRDTYQEVSEVLMRPKFDRYQSTENRQQFLALYQFAAEMVAVTTSITDCRDPKDDKFLELAIDGQVDCIISSDKDLLTLHPYRGIVVCTPREALEQVVTCI